MEGQSLQQCIQHSLLKRVLSYSRCQYGKFSHSSYFLCYFVEEIPQGLQLMANGLVTHFYWTGNVFEGKWLYPQFSG